MRGYPALATLLAAAVATTANANPLLVERGGSCPADNCARLVTGTRAGLPTTRLADCSSFLQATVIPPATTTTITVYSFVQSSTTVTTIIDTDSSDLHPTVYTGLTREPPKSTYSNPYGKRDGNDAAATAPSSTTVFATAIPPYASSACRGGGGGGSAYSRACSCAGVTAGVSTALTPTSSVFVSTTQTLDRLNLTATSVVTLSPTATATAAATGLPCNATYGHFGVYRANGTVHCGLALNRAVSKARMVYGYATADEYRCLGDAAAGKYYSFATYRFSNGSCEFYSLSGTVDPSTDLYPDPDSDYITKQFYADG